MDFMVLYSLICETALLQAGAFGNDALGPNK